MFAARFVLAAVAFASAVQAAQPPACLLGALQGLPNPADMKAACDTFQDAVTGNLTEVCASADVSAAYAAYSSTCSLNGVTVAALASESASVSATATGTAKTTATAKTTGTTKTTGTATGTATATATATATGVSGSSSGASAAAETAAAASASGSSVTTSAGATTAPQPLSFMVTGLSVLSLASLLLL